MRWFHLGRWFGEVHYRARGLERARKGKGLPSEVVLSLRILPGDPSPF